jgi:hypothetical protein
LILPASPQPFGYAKASKMFKPQGAGPFPAMYPAYVPCDAFDLAERYRK